MTAQTIPDQLDQLIEAKFELIPLHNHAKIDVIKGKPRQRGKSPIHRNWTKRTYTAINQVNHMEAGDNVGVRLRATDLVIDVDPRNFKPVWKNVDPFTELVLQMGINPDEFPTVITGSGGLHIYMEKDADISTVDSLPDFPGVEFKSIGRQVVAPGSLHPDTHQPYQWSGNTADDLGWLGAPSAPNSLLERIGRPKATQVSGGGEYDQEELSEMLDHLDPEEFSDHDRWLTLMQACHHATAGDGREEFIEWCTNDPAYVDDGFMIGMRWDSLHAGGKGARVTYRTLHHIMHEHGVADAVPRPRPSDDFADDDLDQIGDGKDVNLPSERSIRPVHEGGLTVNPKTSIAPDTAKNALRAVHGSGLKPRFNELKQRVIFAGDMPWVDGYGRELTDHTARLARLLLMQIKQGCDYQPSKDNVFEAVMTLAYADKFNPILDYLDGLTWDEESRVERLFSDGFPCGKGPYISAVSRCFMIGAVARQRSPGCKLDTMPVIKGPQGSLKSTGFRDLFSTDWFSDAEMGDLRNKDAAMNLEGVWVHEFAELAGLRAGDMDVLKAFMSRAADRFRAPYGRTVEDHPRRIVFAGTVNEGGYLSDPTGGRRFWPLEMEPGSRVDLDWINENKDQLWAEADVLYGSGIGHILPEDLWSVAAERQSNETVDDPWADQIAEMLSNRRKYRADFESQSGDYAPEEIKGAVVKSSMPEPPLASKVHTQDLLGHLGLEGDRQTRIHAQRIRRVMESLGWNYRRSVRIEKRIGAGYIFEEM